MIAKRVFAVDDDTPIRQLLSTNLKAEGYDITTFDSGSALLMALSGQLPDLIILDWMMPGMDGLELCQRLRGNERTCGIPIIMLTARDQEMDMILSLEMGADDYIAKPFSMRGLLTRMKAIFRRVERLSAPEARRMLTVSGVELDAATRRVMVDGVPVSLTLKEFELLKILMASAGRVLTRDFLLETIWGYEYDGGTRTVDVHIMQLRKRLGARESAIETVRGVGYRLTGEGA